MTACCSTCSTSARISRITLSDNASPEAIDQIISTGERLAARIVAALLRQNNLRGVAIDASDVIITDEVFGNATPNLSLTRERIDTHLIPLLSRGIIPVITGFIGATPKGKITTLGRGGSDYTASILAACSDAREVWVWTDVDGMMTADPREIAGARVIPDALLRRSGRTGLFRRAPAPPRMIVPLREQQIALRVRNVFKPQQAGHAGTERHDSTTGFKAVTTIQGVGLAAPHSGSLASDHPLGRQNAVGDQRQPHRSDDRRPVVGADVRLLRRSRPAPDLTRCINLQAALAPALQDAGDSPTGRCVRSAS